MKKLMLFMLLVGFFGISQPSGNTTILLHHQKRIYLASDAYKKPQSNIRDVVYFLCCFCLMP